MSDTVQTFGLNIHLVSFHLPDTIYGSNDDLRVGITTLPEHEKSNYVIPGSKISFANHVFTVNVRAPTQECKDLPSNATQKIIVSFRKKGILSNPMIASAIIHASDFPKVNSSDPQEIVCDEIKKIDVYEPIDKQIKEIKNCQEKGLAVPFEHTDHNTIARNVIGYMEVQLSLAPPMEGEALSKFNYKASTNEFKDLKDNRAKNNSKSSFKQTMSSIKQTMSQKLGSIKNNNPTPDTEYHHFE